MSDPGYGGTQFGGWIVAQALTGLSIRRWPASATGCGGFTGCSRSRSSRASRTPRPRTCCRASVSLSLRDPMAGKRLALIPPERAAIARRLRRAGRLQPAASAPARRVHEVRPLPRGVSGECDRPPAVPARRDPGASRARAAAPHGRLRDRRPARVAGRRHGHDGDGLARERDRRGRRSRRDVWSCMQCNACVEICPVGIEQAPIINQLRRRLVEEGELDPNLQSTLEVIHKSGNSFGENKRRRGRWTAGARLRGPRRPQAAGRRALVRRRLRVV